MFEANRLIQVNRIDKTAIGLEVKPGSAQRPPLGNRILQQLAANSASAVLLSYRHFRQLEAVRLHRQERAASHSLPCCRGHKNVASALKNIANRVVQNHT